MEGARAKKQTVQLADLIAPDGVTDARLQEARESFWAFCKLMGPKFFKEERAYQKEMANTLQGIYEGTLINPTIGKLYKKLTISIPPRHGKSYMLCLFCMWVMGRDNEQRVIDISYNETLSQRFARGVRDGIDATKVDPRWIIYSDIFPKTKIKQGDASMQIWALEGQFFSFLAAGFGGTITGIGCSIGIIDDPVKNHMEAFNDRVLDEQYAWYADTFLSRIEEGGIQIIVMTRWSTKDLVGRVLADAPDEWYELRMPAYNADTDKMLCEDVLSRESYEAKKRVTSPGIFEANFQSTPIDIQGRLYSEFATYEDTPRDAKGHEDFDRIIAYVDTADTGRDYLCAIVAGVREGRAWVLYVLYTDAPMEKTEPQTADMLALCNVQHAEIESNNGGRGFARNVERLLWERHGSRKVSISWFHQSANKQARILSSATFVMQHVQFPEDWARRWPEYHKAMTSYQRKGKSAHDDAPDATTGLAEMMQRGVRRKRFFSGKGVRD